MTLFAAVLIYCAGESCMALQGDVGFPDRPSCESFLAAVATDAPDMLRQRSFCREYEK